MTKRALSICLLAFALQWQTSDAFVVTRPSLPRHQTTTLPASQVLEFVEPTTGVTVKLIGAMHYNPASIALTEDTITDLAANNQLGSVLIESCDVRWNSTLALPPKISRFLESEMRTGYELGLQYNVPVVLGDQRIHVTTSRMGSALKETLQDLVNPRRWSAIVGNITEARAVAAPLGRQYLGAGAFFDPKLLLAAPVSLVKYPFSYFVKSPLLTSVLFALLFWADSSSAATINANEVVSTSDLALSLVGSLLETLVFARIFLKELLVERNQVLAKQILEQCRYYQPRPVWKRLLRRQSTDTVYAEGSPLPAWDASSGKVVVAVLGMAHCNGIRKILEEQRV